MSSDDFRKYGYALIDWIADYHQNVESMPVLSQVKPGEVRVQTPDSDEEQIIYVSGGMLEIQPAAVTVLADTAMRAHDIDEAAALEAKDRAEKMLDDQKDDIDYAAASAELAEAMAQLQAVQRLKKKLGR